MSANISNKSRKSCADSNTGNNPGKNAAYRTSASSHAPIHSKARINWFILGSWSVVLIIGLAFWAGVIALFM